MHVIFALDYIYSRVAILLLFKHITTNPKSRNQEVNLNWTKCLKNCLEWL